MTHTPTPWAYDPIDGCIYVPVNPLTKYVIADMECNSEANAAFIVRAVNSHDKLVEALRAVLGAVRDHLPPDGIGKDEFINRVIYAVDNPDFNEAAKGLDL